MTRRITIARIGALDTIPGSGFSVMTKRRALEELINSMFNDELRLFLGETARTAPHLAGLPGRWASPQQVMFETVGLRNRVIDSESLVALSAATPRPAPLRQARCR